MTTNDYLACFQAFRGPAEEFFRIVDSASEAEPVEFLRQIQLILPQLHLALLRLPSLDRYDWEGDAEVPGRSHQEWAALYERLKKVLGAYNLYWMVFDSRTLDDEPIHGSIANDLADIYFDLRGPIQASQREIPVACVLWTLRFGFLSHWGHHLVCASKAIHDRLSDREMGTE